MAMSEERDVSGRVRDWIVQEVDGTAVPEVNDTTPLFTGGLLDSIATMRLVSFLEDEFAISIDARDMTIENLNTITDITRVVKGKLAAQQS
jgi:acyl carrier protein